MKIHDERVSNIYLAIIRGMLVQVKRYLLGVISRLPLTTNFKGYGAPKGVHPNNIQRKHRGRVNIKQRVPYMSKSILQNPVEYSILAEAFTDLFELLRVAVNIYLHCISSLL
jgi:hypothetical protein